MWYHLIIKNFVNSFLEYLQQNFLKLQLTPIVELEKYFYLRKNVEIKRFVKLILNKKSTST